MKMLRNGQSKLVVISNNCPAIRKTQLEYMAILGGSKVLHFDGNNVELGKLPTLPPEPSCSPVGCSSLDTPCSNLAPCVLLTFAQALPSPECTESACSPFRTLAIPTSSLPSSTEHLRQRLQQQQQTQQPHADAGSLGRDELKSHEHDDCRSSFIFSAKSANHSLEFLSTLNHLHSLSF